MIDPAFDTDDYHQDAQLALLQGRLKKVEGISTAIRNAKRSAHRKMACRKRHRSQIADRYVKLQQNHSPMPFDLVANSEAAVLLAQKLYRNNPKLLATMLFGLVGLTRQLIAEITGQSLGTVSRSHHRARELLDK